MLSIKQTISLLTILVFLLLFFNNCIIPKNEIQSIIEKTNKKVGKKFEYVDSIKGKYKKTKYLCLLYHSKFQSKSFKFSKVVLLKGINGNFQQIDSIHLKGTVDYHKYSTNSIFGTAEKTNKTLPFLKDINKDSTPEVVLFVNLTGTAWSRNYIKIYTLKDEKLKNITPKPKVKTLIPKGIADLNEDEKFEVFALDTQFEFYGYSCHQCSPKIYSIYEWNKVEGSYELASFKFPDFYKTNINRDLRYLNKSDFFDKENYAGEQDNYFGTVITILINHIYIGEQKKGLKVFKEYTDKYKYFHKDNKKIINKIIGDYCVWIKNNKINQKTKYELCK